MLDNYLSNTFDSYEIIIIDDGSTDGTKKIIESIINKNIKAVFVTKNSGKGNAIKQGVLHSGGNLIFFTDADMPYRLENFERAAKVFETENADCVIGNRDKYKKAYPFFRRFFSNTLAFIVKLVLKLDIYDTQCGFKGFKKSAAKRVFPMLTIDGFAFDIEALMLFEKFSYKIVPIDVELITHNQKTSSVNIFKDTIRIFFDLFKIKFNHK